MILDDIVAAKRTELAAQVRSTTVAQLRERTLFGMVPPPFLRALQIGQGRKIIAEVKRASPSRGVIRSDFAPVSLALSCARNGAAAVSVLTEARYFQGSLAHLEQIRHAVPLPLLRKDFVFDPYQLYEARAYGASAVLLIVAILSDGQLVELSELAASLQLDCLIEVHDEAQLERALACRVELLGINNRDLTTFHTNIQTTERLMRLVPQGVFVVSESGLTQSAQLTRLEACGVGAFLIGETFMAAPDPGEPLRALLRGDVWPSG